VLGVGIEIGVMAVLNGLPNPNKLFELGLSLVLGLSSFGSLLEPLVVLPPPIAPPLVPPTPPLPGLTMAVYASNDMTNGAAVAFNPPPKPLESLSNEFPVLRAMFFFLAF